MKKFNLLHIICILTAYLSTSSVATSFDRQFIENLAKKTVEENVSNQTDKVIKVHHPKLDERIQIGDCEQAPIAQVLKQHSRSVNVKISCQSPRFWQIFVPVKVQSLVPVLVAKAPLAKGNVLDSNNTEIQMLPEHKVRGAYLTTDEGILGARINKNLRPNAPIFSRNICVVCKGENVTLIAKSETFSIKTAGVALQNGSIGEQVKIKNIRSGKTVVGRISAINKVEINL